MTFRQQERKGSELFTPGGGAVHAVKRLTARRRRELEALARICRQRDGLEVPLHLEPARSERDTSQFVALQGDFPVGFASLDDSLEVLGAVHPDHRRRGVATALLGAVVQECRRRGAAGLLLVCEEGAGSGRAFAESAGGRYRFSEHRMELDREAFARRKPVRATIDVRLARPEDLEDLVALRTSAFAGADKSARREIVRWLGEVGQRIQIARLQGRAIGMVRDSGSRSGSFITSLAVDPELQGRGLGRAILEHAVETLLAESRSADSEPPILLEVETGNRRALSLYTDCGFRETSTYRYYRIEAA